MDQALAEFLNYRNVGMENREFTVRLIQELNKHLEEVDSLLAAHLKNWSPERLAVLDRLMIRLAVTEFLFLKDIPHKVTINEYVGIAHLFGTDDSPRFINGVLDAVHRTLTGNNKKARQEPDSRPGG